MLAFVPLVVICMGFGIVFAAVVAGPGFVRDTSAPPPVMYAPLPSASTALPDAVPVSRIRP